MKRERWIPGWMLLAMVLIAPLCAAEKVVRLPATAPRSSTPASAPVAEKSQPYVGWLELSEPLRDEQAPVVVFSPEEAGPSLNTLLYRLEQLSADPSCKGLVVYLDEPELTLTHVSELSAAFKRLRTAGKKVLVFAEAYDLPGYVLACAADEILLQRKGEVEITGIGMEEMYLAGLFDKIGVKADLLQIGRFKGARDPFTRTGPSEGWDQNINGLLDDLYDYVVARIAETRKLTRKQVEAIFADAQAMTDDQCIQRRVVDRLVNRDLTEATEANFGTDFEWKDLLNPDADKAMMDNPMVLLSRLLKPAAPPLTRPTIVLMYACGPIASGEGVRASGTSPAGAGLFDSTGVASRTLTRALSDARDDPMVRGVVLRVDSPGGSALASEIIWQALEELGGEKPLYVSVGHMAASGGYYLACAGERIYVEPTSIVGSIGVVGGKIVLGDLYQKIGINVTRRSRGPLGDLYNSVAPFDDAQRQAVQQAMEKTYALFTQRVSESRGKHIPDLDAVAQGRIFTGREAIKNGLADRIGGVRDAIADLAAELDLKPGTYDVVERPEPMTLPEFLKKRFGAQAPSAQAAAHLQLVRQVLGPRVWRDAAPVLEGMMQLRREPVLALTPTALVIR